MIVSLAMFGHYTIVSTFNVSLFEEGILPRPKSNQIHIGRNKGHVERLKTKERIDRHRPINVSFIFHSIILDWHYTSILKTIILISCRCLFLKDINKLDKRMWMCK